MTVKELIEQLQKQRPDATVQFYDMHKDTFLPLSFVEPGRVKGAEVCTIGEAPVKRKIDTARIMKQFHGLVDNIKSKVGI